MGPSLQSKTAPPDWGLRSPVESKNHFGLGSFQMGDGILRTLDNFGAVRTAAYTCELDEARANLDWADWE